MVQSQFSLSWNSYKSSICGGFSSLQQNGEFVDMTLAADGHFVKVHQVLMALVSPYLKELITSAPCQHPVIFLNNVSHRTLCSLLEYIYTGEALLPSDNLSSFMETAKALHIKGLEHVDNTDNMVIQVAENISQMEDRDICHMTGYKSLVVPTDTGSEQVKLPAAARKIFVQHSSTPKTADKIKPQLPIEPMDSKDDMHDYTEMLDDHQDSDEEQDPNDSMLKNSGNINEPNSNLQYSVSIRGALQVILNRYIYNLHTTQRSGIKRWRCVEYRNHRCKAFLITKGNVVLNRANLHNHPFHDKKILSKIEKKAVYSALDDVEEYKAKEYGKDANETLVEHEDFITLEYNPAESDKEWSNKTTH